MQPDIIHLHSSKIEFWGELFSQNQKLFILFMDLILYV